MMLNVGIINFIENFDEKILGDSLLDLISNFIKSLNTKKRMNFIIDMFTLTVSNLIYNTDNVIQKNGVF